MCGIFCILRSKTDPIALRKRALILSAKLRHRGPDWNGVCVQNYKCQDDSNIVTILCHERLAIVDPKGGAQPLHHPKKNISLAVNGEIWNHNDIRHKYSTYEFSTNSDCEPIIPLYDEYGEDLAKNLDGVFAFVISDQENDICIACRDPIGVVPLYIGWTQDGTVWFASEMKSLIEDCTTIQEFPPGHYWSSRLNDFKRWYNPSWYDEHIPNEPFDLVKLRDKLEKSVIKRLMSDVPYGVLLSGGLDSSLIASIASRHAGKRYEDGKIIDAWWPKLHTFSIGLKDSPDLKAAQEVADFLGTVHHSFNFTPQEGLDAIRDVIYHIETYDVTTIRASTPMYLLARRIKAMGVKMVLSGEGADEIFGGYLYFHFAPSPEEFHKETCKKLKLLSKYDCLRANKSTSAWGLEVRCPFLDIDFLDVAMNIDPKEKMIDKKRGKIEKWILRKAFDDKDNPYLPDNVLWRQKEQFSDGVGYNWIDTLKEVAENEVTIEQLKNAHFRWTYNTPITKEAYFYRNIFQSLFPGESAAKTVPGGPSIACSSPTAFEWMKKYSVEADPSGRAVNVHEHAIAEQ